MRLSGRLMHKLLDHLSLILLLLFLFVFLRLGLLFPLFIFFDILILDSFQIKEMSVRRFKLKVLHAISQVWIFLRFIALRIFIFILFFSNDAILESRRIFLFTALFLTAAAWILVWRRTITGAVRNRRRFFTAATKPLATKIFFWRNWFFKIFGLWDDYNLFFAGSWCMAGLAFISFCFFLNSMSLLKGRLFGKSTNGDDLRWRNQTSSAWWKLVIWISVFFLG